MCYWYEKFAFKICLIHIRCIKSSEGMRAKAMAGPEASKIT